MDANVTVTANPGYGTNDHLLNVNAQNITIIGAGAATSVFHMLKAQYTSGEWRHCLDIENATNVTVSGISCNDSGGDGLYLRATAPTSRWKTRSSTITGARAPASPAA